MRDLFRDMRAAGLTNWDILGEFLGALCVFLVPILMLFIGAAFGL